MLIIIVGWFPDSLRNNIFDADESGIDVAADARSDAAVGFLTSRNARA